MLILNITFIVAEGFDDKWLQWVNETHIPYMISSGYFTEPRLVKVISDNGLKDTSYAVQYLIEDMQMLETWQQKFNAKMELDCALVFGEDVFIFSTVLEIIK